MNSIKALIIAFILAPVPSFGFTITFDAIVDTFATGVPITTEFAAQGVTFAQAIVLSAGLSLNEIEFPPHSGTNVVADDGGPLVLTFAEPVTEVGGFFTHIVPLTVRAFDAVGNQLGAAVVSVFDDNRQGTGDPGSLPNAFLQVIGVGLIRSLEIMGDPLGSSFTLDDLQVTLSTPGTPSTPIPEPGSLLLLMSGLAGLVAFRIRTLRR